VQFSQNKSLEGIKESKKQGVNDQFMRKYMLLNSRKQPFLINSFD
jgi:hypothetical protein